MYALQQSVYEKTVENYSSPYYCVYAYKVVSAPLSPGIKPNEPLQSLSGQ